SELLRSAGDLERRALDSLRYQQYAIRKAYEYRSLQPYGGTLALTDLVSRALQEHETAASVVPPQNRVPESEAASTRMVNPIACGDPFDGRSIDSLVSLMSGLFRSDLADSRSRLQALLNDQTLGTPAAPRLIKLSPGELKQLTKTGQLWLDLFQRHLFP